LDISSAGQSQLSEMGLSHLSLMQPFSVCADELDLRRSVPTYNSPSQPYQTFTSHYRLPKTLA